MSESADDRSILHVHCSYAALNLAAKDGDLELCGCMYALRWANGPCYCKWASRHSTVVEANHAEFGVWTLAKNGHLEKLSLIL
ncbi:hypothetical protein GQ600_26917 [Phytophthora cactorum]|nr:hypothetical protein GQ600_26917 [Phytophthora cactorum]